MMGESLMVEEREKKRKGDFFSQSQIFWFLHARAANQCERR